MNLICCVSAHFVFLTIGWSLQEIDLVHCRISSLAPLRLPRFAQTLRKLCLRQNFITVLDPQDFRVLKQLAELDLYDNNLKTLGDALVDSKLLRFLVFASFRRLSI
jgi:protein phosphatase 1 regulatory subunit 7